jgi:hypothetical protein
MYSSKEYCPKNGKLYLATGEPYSDVKEAVPGRWKGKQMVSPPTKTGEGGQFHKLSYLGGEYNDKSGYLQEQPMEGRKLGFGSKDANKRGEYSGHIASEQLRATIKSEKRTAEKGPKSPLQIAALQSVSSSTGSPKLPPSSPINLFDSIRDHRSPRSVHGYNPKQGLRHGKFTTTASSIGGEAAGQAERPQYARVAATRSFYDPGHLS